MVPIGIPKNLLAPPKRKAFGDVPEVWQGLAPLSPFSTKLSVYFSLIIVLVLSGYCYFHILSHREILIKKMNAEV
jgi:hypothetical protein